MEKKWSAESKQQLDGKAIAAHFRETFPRRYFIFYLLGGFWERERPVRRIGGRLAVGVSTPHRLLCDQIPTLVQSPHFSSFFPGK